MNDLFAQIGVAVAGFLGLVLILWRQRRKGRTEGREAARTQIEKEIKEDVQKRVESGRKAVERGRSSGATPADRLRQNDGRWQ